MIVRSPCGKVDVDHLSAQFHNFFLVQPINASPGKHKRNQNKLEIFSKSWSYYLLSLFLISLTSLYSLMQTSISSSILGMKNMKEFLFLLKTYTGLSSWFFTTSSPERDCVKFWMKFLCFCKITIVRETAKNVVPRAWSSFNENLLRKSFRF